MSCGVWYGLVQVVLQVEMSGDVALFTSLSCRARRVIYHLPGGGRGELCYAMIACGGLCSDAGL